MIINVQQVILNAYILKTIQVYIKFIANVSLLHRKLKLIQDI